MIIVRRNFSEEADNKNAETRQQARVRKAGATLGVIGASSLGATVAGGLANKKGIENLASRIKRAGTGDEVRNSVRRAMSGFTGRSSEELRKLFEHDSYATGRFADRGLKKVKKAVGKNAVKGAAVGGAIAAGLYGLSRKNLIKQNEEKNRRLAMRRERLAEKQKED